MTIIQDISFLVAPAAFWIINRWVLNRVLSTPVLFIAATAVCYFLIIARVHAIDAEISADLARLELNGSFSDGEMTPEAQRAMDRFAHDTGRTMAPITGGPFAAIWVGITF